MTFSSLRKLVLSAPLFLFACTAEKPAEPKPAESQPAEAQPAGAPQQAAAAAPADRALDEVATYDVKCGCSIDGVGHCGNFVMIEGNYIPILHPKLGKMEWCRNKAAGAKIKANGEIKDGKFVAKNWKTIQ